MLSLQFTLRGVILSIQALFAMRLALSQFQLLSTFISMDDAPQSALVTPGVRFCSAVGSGLPGVGDGEGGTS